ncbi:hypothetical protein HYW19_01395 [Candidatus Woesearchaeota archaeon]|nr:hypothetical protein [Candidatus Woesearchaeota archaeon]
MADKKIKVEAEVTTKKNVVSGIGKGFGIVIGIFLALIVIAVSCSILISSNAKKIEEKSNEITANAIKEAYRTGEEAQQQIQKTFDESLPIDEKAKEKDEEFKFSPDSIVNTQNGISLSLDDFKYEVKGENWGKITEITLTVLNEGNNEFYPKVLVQLYDEKDRKEDKFRIQEEIEFDIFGLGVGEHITKKAVTNIGFNDLNLPKKLILILVDAFDYNNRAMVVVEKDFIAE